MHVLLHTLLAAPLLAPQSAVPGAAPAAAEDGWVLLDGVAAQAGDEIITIRELDQLVRRESQKYPIESKEDLDRLTWSVLESLATNRLEPQAGEDMGFNAEDIAAFVRMSIDRSRRQDGALVFRDMLEERGQDRESHEESEQKGVYRDLWERSKIGYQGLAGTRRTRDRFIRPGELRAIYRSYKVQLNPPTVELQLMVTPYAAWGGEEAAREGLTEIRRRAEAGEDFGDLVEEINPIERRQNRGIQAPVRATEIQIPALREFAMTAEAGDLGPFIPVEAQGGMQYLLFPRLHSREADPPPPFAERDVQTSLRQRILQGRDGMILQTERANLLQKAYSWVNPALRHLKATAEARRGAGRPALGASPSAPAPGPPAAGPGPAGP